MEVFGARLKEAMDRRDMSPKQVASATGLSYNTVLSYLRGDRNPTCRAIVEICRRLEVSADWLLGLR